MDATRKQILQLVHARRPLPPPEERVALRKAAHLRLQDIADVLGVTVATVWNWERGDVTPSKKHFDAYRDALEALARQQAS